jgi:hypothetical protein
MTVTARHVDYDKTRLGEQKVIVTVEGKTATFPVTVRGLVSIEVTRAPQKTVYAEGEALDVRGIEVMGTYSDATKEKIRITPRQVDYDATRVGEQKVIVTVAGKTATFFVTVEPPTPREP